MDGEVGQVVHPGVHAEELGNQDMESIVTGIQMATTTEVHAYLMLAAVSPART